MASISTATAFWKLSTNQGHLKGAHALAHGFHLNGNSLLEAVDEPIQEGAIHIGVAGACDSRQRGCPKWQIDGLMARGTARVASLLD